MQREAIFYVREYVLRYLSRCERKIARLRLKGEQREEKKTTGDRSKFDWGDIQGVDRS
jgi:hypothetical protein